MLYVNPPDMNIGRFADAELRATHKREVALREFERLFLLQLVREMRATVPKDALFPNSPMRQFSEEILNDALAGEMAASGQFGLARQMEMQLAPPDRESGNSRSEQGQIQNGMGIPSRRVRSSYLNEQPIHKAATASQENKA